MNIPFGVILGIFALLFVWSVGQRSKERTKEMAGLRARSSSPASKRTED